MGLGEVSDGRIRPRGQWQSTENLEYELILGLSHSKSPIIMPRPPASMAIFSWWIRAWLLCPKGAIDASLVCHRVDALLPHPRSEMPPDFPSVEYTSLALGIGLLMAGL